MATTIITKNGSGAPAAGDLTAGELAVDLTNKRLYSKDSSNNVIELGTTPSGISGGTIDNTVIGGTTPAAGAFTTLSATGNLTVDTNTLFVDSTNNRVGIGTTSPAVDLQVNGTSRVTDGTTNIDAVSAGGVGYFGTQTAHDLSLRTSDTVRMTLDATSGNVGIGTSDPQTTTHIKGPTTSDLSDLGDGTLYVQSSETATTEKGAVLALGGHYSGTTGEVGLGYVSGVKDSSGIAGNLVFHTRASGTSTPEVMRLTHDGNVGIGTDDPTEILHLSKSSAPIMKIENTDTSLTTDQVIGAIQWRANDPSGSGVGDCSQIAVRSGSTVGGQCYMQFTTSDSSSLNQERMRIDSTGSLCVGEASSDIKGRVHAYAPDTRCYSARFTGSNGSSIGYWSEFDNTSGDAYHMYIRYNNSQVGLISSNSTTTTYGTSSDERLKENIVDAPTGNIDDVRVRSFDWRVDGTHQTYGVIAQEIADVAPEAVTKGKTEDDMWQVDYSKLVPMMIKEIQDLKAKVAELESR